MSKDKYLNEYTPAQLVAYCLATDDCDDCLITDDYCVQEKIKDLTPDKDEPVTLEISIE